MATPFVVNLADGDSTPHFAKVGVALRFARVLRYRHDKTADEADTIATVQALAPGA